MPITFIETPGFGFFPSLILGTSNNDFIFDPFFASLISTGAGDDTVFARFGNDIIFTGTGDDRAFAGGGNDFVEGGEGDDELGGGAGNDLIVGGEGDDTLYGATGRDELNGGTGSDEIWAGSGNDTVDGGAGDDIIYGGTGNDLLIGGQGADTVITGSGRDTLLYQGPAFNEDVSAEGRQIVGGEDFVTDFDQDRDVFAFDKDDFDLEDELVFASLDANAEGAEIAAGTNVIVLTNSDNDGDGGTPFLAGTAANQIAGLYEDGADPEAGFFIYYNSNLELNRLVYSSDLTDATADLQIINRLTDVTGDDAIAALAGFDASQFDIV